MPAELDIEIVEEDAVIMINVRGPVDSATIEEFKKRLDATCLRPKKDIIMDCSGLTYLNSRAMGVLVSNYKKALLDHKTFCLANLSAPLQRSFDLLNLGQRLRKYNSLTEAKEALQTQ